MTCKIYLLTNIINGKIYVGQSWLPLSKRMGKDGSGYEGCTHLYNAIKKHGVKNFKYSILCECDNQSDADRLEDEYMESCGSRNTKIGYNLKRGGRGGRHSNESRAKISASLMGREMSEESVKRGALKRRKVDLEKENLVIETYKAGETIKNIGLILNVHTSYIYRILDRYKVPRSRNFTRWIGKTHSEETKNKISGAASDRWSSEQEEKEISGNKHPGKGGSGKGKFNQEKSKEIVEKYISGKTLESLKKEYDCSRDSILTILKYFNIDLRPRPKAKKKKYL